MKKILQKIQIALLVFLLAGSAMMVLVPGDSEAVIFPEIDITATPSVTLDVSPGGSGLGVIYVTVRNNAYDCSVRVRITVDAPGYQVSPAISSVNLPPDSEKTIPVAVVAVLRSNYRTTSATINGVVTHVNSVPADGSYEANTGFLLLTEPYGKVILQSDKPFQKVKPGSEYPFKVRVVNSGNAVDTFSLEILNKDKLADDGFSISLSSSTTKSTDPESYDVITIQLQTPREFGWKNTYYTMDVQATSEVNGRTDFYSITIWVHGFGVSGFEPLYSIIALVLVATLLGKKRTK